MGKRQCECGSYLFYIYEYPQPNTSVIICMREENEGMAHHKTLMHKNEYTGESK